MTKFAADYLKYQRIMCSNKILYQPGDSDVAITKQRRKKEMLSFQQIAFMTDCLRMLGNRLDMPIFAVSQVLTSKAAYCDFYRMVTTQPELSKVQVTNRLHKLITAK